MLDYLFEKKEDPITLLGADKELKVEKTGVYRIEGKEVLKIIIKPDIDVVLIDENPTTTNIIINSGSKLDYYAILKENRDININFDNSGFLNTYFIDLSSNITVKSKINLISYNAKLNFNSIIYADATNKKEYDLSVDHLESGTNSDFFNYGVINDFASLKVDVSSLVKKGMNKSNAFQKTKVISLSKNAKAFLNPILYIDEFDISGGHGASFGKISDQELYYMKSRGLNEEEAKQMLALGNLLAKIPEYMREEIERLLLKRVNNE